VPRVRRKIDKNSTYEAWTAFASDDPPNTVVSVGERFTGDHGAVQANPHFFVESGSAPHTWPSQLGTDKAPDPEPSPVPDADVSVNAMPAPLDDQVELVRSLRVLVGYGSKPRLVTYQPGRRFARDSEVVVLLNGRGFFREARR
jgi:hypothetical protein